MSLLNLKSLRSNRIVTFFIMAFSAVARQKSLMDIIGAAWRIAGKNGMRGLRESFKRFVYRGITYERWISLYDTLSNEDNDAIRLHTSKLSSHPVISIFIPARRTDRIWLRRAIESVRSQIYPHWELFIYGVISENLDISAYLEEYANSDGRISFVSSRENEHSASTLIMGDFTTILNPNDELPPHALYMTMAILNEKPFLDLIYSDEDRIDENGFRSDPYFKPGWNPDFLTSQNYMSRLSVYRTETVKAAGGISEDFDELDAWDLSLKVCGCIPDSNIHHIPHILYHRRAITSAATNWQKEQTDCGSSAAQILKDHLSRTSQKGRILKDRSGRTHIEYQVPANTPLVSIIIPTCNKLTLLRQCIESIIKKTLYTNYEIIIVDNRSDDDGMIDYLTSLEKAETAKVLKYQHPFNYSAINNFAAEAARGEFLCLMNNDIEVISECWLNEMIGHAARPGIGVVGAMLYYPDNKIQHAGVILLKTGVAGHLYTGKKRGIDGYHGRASSVQNLSAVTAACFVIRASIYRAVGGFDETNLPVSFNDVDFCLKVRDKGHRNLWTPFAEFYHNESATRGPDDNEEKKARFQRETSYMLARWAHELCNDPAHNPNLTFYNGHLYLESEPQVKKPWTTYFAFK